MVLGHRILNACLLRDSNVVKNCHLLIFFGYLNCLSRFLCSYMYDLDPRRDEILEINWFLCLQNRQIEE